MEKINYPLLYYKIKEDALLGILVGPDSELVERDLKSLKTAFSSYLQKEYKKHNSYPYFGIVNPRMKIVKVTVRPAYRQRFGSFPLSQFIQVPIPVVFGENRYGYYECFLPTFNHNFYYYDPKQFESLVDYTATSFLNNYNPERIYKLIMQPKPKMELVTLKIKPEKTYEWKGHNYERKYEKLARLAEQYPYSKAVKRNVNNYPDAAWELEDKVQEVQDKLMNSRSNILLVGESGTGKSAILKQVIKKISAKRKNQNLEYTFWRIMAQRITASSKYLGEWQEAVEELISDLQAANGVLWVVDLARLLQSGGTGPEDSVAAFLIAFLQQGRLQLIGEVSPQELESMRRLLPGFVEHFQIIAIEELEEQKIHRILDKFGEYSTKNLEVKLQGEALQMAYRLLKRYYPYERFPGKAIKFLGQCISAAKINNRKRIGSKEILNHFIQQTGLPELIIRDDLILDPQELTTFFESKIIGQPKVIENLTGIVKIFKAGLNNPYKPINTLLFAGPTGVGKTASAKALSDYFFGKGQKKSPLIRIDMSEFQHPGQIGRLIGSGATVGQLVKDIRERPFSVLLLDEVEKAHPAIFDVLLTVLDEGILVDNYGRVTNFRNTIIIMTSNLGAQHKKSVGFTSAYSEEAQYESAIGRFFRPEFINRIDSIVLFNPLNEENIRKITIKELEELKTREGFVKRNLSIEFSEATVSYLSRIGFDERYGARPLQRVIEQHLVARLANWLVNNPGANNQKIKVDYDRDWKLEV